MPRFARVVIPDLPHHVTQRGNRHQTVFTSNQERSVYLCTLAEDCSRYGAAVIGYCLMSNHVHLIVVPAREDSLAKALGRTHCNYARWRNITELQHGHLWQNRFYSCPLEGRHLWKALRYVETNPVRAGMVASACDWPWSSARAHVTGRDTTGLLSMKEWEQQYEPRHWEQVLAAGLTAAEWEQRLRSSTRCGRPFGSHNFIVDLEKQTGRHLRPLKRGPAPKKKEALAEAAKQMSFGV